MNELLDQLITMSRALGDPREDWVILGEGNTSVRADQESFWVKASGTQLREAEPASFVRVALQPVLAALADETPLSDDGVTSLLKSATVEGQRAPSIETFLHALCLQLDGVRFVGHTHPTAAVGLLSSQRSGELFAGSMFPDQIVLLGPAYVYIPYRDPGLPLARAVQDEIRDFCARESHVPRLILMENHGVIALGSTPQQVLDITQMAVKTCRIIAATLASGGPRFLTSTQVNRIDKRPDELKRRDALAQRGR
jgi:rhamnose utilization protein RhaD (predicted bifunctional aldolase and dehydrogenase)